MFRRRGGYRRLSTTNDPTNHTADASDAFRENPIVDRSRYASEISSSLSLQILIYYNGLFSLVYFILEAGLITEKVGSLDGLPGVD